MKQIQENYDLGLFNDKIEFPAKVSKAGVRLDKCSQCGSAFYGAGNLKKTFENTPWKKGQTNASNVILHLYMHAQNLRRHLENTHCNV